MRNSGSLLYIATGTATDAEMAERIETHRRRRDDRFDTVDAGMDLVGSLSGREDQPALIDSLGPWVAAHPDFAVDIAGLSGALTARRAATIVVSDEVGMGVHPSTDVGRRFRDALGSVNQAVAEVAGEVLLVVAGRVLPLIALERP